MLSKILGKNLKKIRLAKGLSQGDIAKRLNVDRSYISGLENGKRNPTLGSLERLTDVLNVSVDKLLKN